MRRFLVFLIVLTALFGAFSPARAVTFDTQEAAYPDNFTIHNNTDITYHYSKGWIFSDGQHTALNEYTGYDIQPHNTVTIRYVLQYDGIFWYPNGGGIQSYPYIAIFPKEARYWTLNAGVSDSPGIMVNNMTRSFHSTSYPLPDLMYYAMIIGNSNNINSVYSSWREQSTNLFCTIPDYVEPTPTPTIQPGYEELTPIPLYTPPYDNEDITVPVIEFENHPELNVIGMFIQFIFDEFGIFFVVFLLGVIVAWILELSHKGG